MKENYIVTLTTEYGNKSPYSAVIKGVLLSKIPHLNVIEFSNDVKSNDIISASYILKTASIHFPPGTIHLIGVDMNPLTYKQMLVVKYNEMFFVGSDNGIFSLLFKNMDVEVFAVDLTKVDYHVSFPEKEIFPYIVEQLVNQVPMDQFAVLANIETIKELLTPAIQENNIKGSVIFIDGYENAITDITHNEFDEMKSKFNSFRVFFRRKSDIRQINNSYEQEKSGEALALFNSFGYLEIAIRQGHAKSLLGLDIGSNIIIEFYD